MIHWCAGKAGPEFRPASLSSLRSTLKFAQVLLLGVRPQTFRPGREQKLILRLKDMLREHPLPAEKEKNTAELAFFFGDFALLNDVRQLLLQLRDVVLRVRRDSMGCPARGLMLFQETSHR